MDLVEYQGKRFFSDYGIPTSVGGVADDIDSAVEVASQLGFPVVVKAQVQVGGRGRAGGIRIARNPSEVGEAAHAILGMDIKGHRVRRVWIEQASDIQREYYVSVTLDRGAKLHLAMVSAKGGVDIEEVVATDPDAIAKSHINPIDGFSLEQASELVGRASIEEEARQGVAEVLVKLYRAFVDGDADLVEINPLILTSDGRIHALDAKVILDDNAAYRHPEWEQYGSYVELDSRERLAKERGLNYIGLSGTVGIIANGAGLAMATLDVVNQVGGSAANFLDLGGGAGQEVMAAALEVINTDDNVKVVLVNVFGGITRCDEVARGILVALDRVKMRSPLVVRLDGTNSREAREILSEHTSENLLVAPTMIDAAKRAVELAGGMI